MELFIGVWLVCAVLGALLAGSRGASSGLGCLLGFLLGPFGVIAALLLGSNTAKAERQQVQLGNLVRCVHCSELIQPSATVCKHCGRDIPETAGVAGMNRLAAYTREQIVAGRSEQQVSKELLRLGHSRRIVNTVIHQATH